MTLKLEDDLRESEMRIGEVKDGKCMVSIDEIGYSVFDLTKEQAERVIKHLTLEFML